MFGLGKAVQKAKALLDKDGLHDVALPVAQERWGYKRLSAAGNQCLAAIAAYGLVTVSGSGDNRQVRVAERARRIIKDAPDRSDCLRDAALSPSLHKELWDKYESEGELPSRENLRKYLLWNRPSGTFNEDAVDKFIDNFTSSLSLAEIGPNRNNGLDLEPRGGSTSNTVQIGDFVQWTSQGIEQFTDPRRVTGIPDDGEWAFVEDSQAGVPMSELTVVDPLKSDRHEQRQPPVNPLHNPPSKVEATGKLGMVNERITLNEGAVDLTMPQKLGRDSAQDFQEWVDDLPNRANRRAGGANRSVPLPSGGTLHLISYPGSDKWQIRSYDFSWFAGAQLMMATVHAVPNGWESIEFDAPEDAVQFVESKPRPSVVPASAM